jgi:hypothetical protein
MTDVQSFHIGDILSVVTGRLVSPDGFSSTQQFLEHLAGESVGTHQCGRVADEAGPWLRKQFPELATIEVPKLDSEQAYGDWLQGVADQLGSHRDVLQFPEGGHDHINPISELVDMVGSEKVVPVVIP